MALIWKSVSRIFMHFSELFFYQEEINLAKLIIINYNDTFFFLYLLLSTVRLSYRSFFKTNSCPLCMVMAVSS